MARKRDKQPPKTKKYFRSTKSGAGMTKAGVAKYRRDNPGSKLKTAVTSSDNCYQYVAKVRTSITQDPQYLNGYSTCVYIGEPSGEKT